MSAPTIGPCSEWIDASWLDEDCVPESMEDEVRDRWITVATNTVYLFSGQQFPGTCETTVRPTCAAHIGPCGCSGVYEIDLGVGPHVIDVLEVTIDGEVVDPGLYRVDDWTTLVRLPDADGYRARWPAWQRMDLEPTEEHTFEVTFTYGRTPPVDLAMAAATLACELIKAATGADDCALPSRVVNASREGITVSTVDPGTFFDRGETGIDSIDMVIRAWNPGGLRSAPGFVFARRGYLHRRPGGASGS